MGDANDSNTTCLLCGDMHRGDCPLLNVLGRKVSNAPDPDSEGAKSGETTSSRTLAQGESEELEAILKSYGIDKPSLYATLMEWRTKSLLPELTAVYKEIIKNNVAGNVKWVGK